jgi:hypothetical protein
MSVSRRRQIIEASGIADDAAFVHDSDRDGLHDGRDG